MSARLRRGGALAFKFVGSLLAGVVMALMIVLVAPNFIGMKSLTILSGSMEPAIDTGDVVVDEYVQPGQLRVGDVITFRQPGGTKLITHRVRSLAREGNKYNVVTKGDANHTAEDFAIPANGEVGRVRYVVPKAGYVAERIGTPMGRLFLIVLPVVLLGIWELVRIWRPSTPKGQQSVPQA